MPQNALIKDCNKKNKILEQTEGVLDTTEQYLNGAVNSQRDGARERGDQEKWSE